MNLILKKPTFQDKDKWLLYVKEYRKFDQEGHPLNYYANSIYEEWLRYINEACQRDGCTNKIPVSVYFVFERDYLVGTLSIQHSLLNWNLAFYGGHVGYSVRPSKRGQGYGTQILSLALFECQKLGLEKIMVSCRRENVASAKVIENNLGVLTREVYVLKENAFYKIYWIHVSRAIEEFKKKNRARVLSIH